MNDRDNEEERVESAFLKHTTSLSLKLYPLILPPVYLLYLTCSFSHTPTHHIMSWNFGLLYIRINARVVQHIEMNIYPCTFFFSFTVWIHLYILRSLFFLSILHPYIHIHIYIDIIHVYRHIHIYFSLRTSLACTANASVLYPRTTRAFYLFSFVSLMSPYLHICMCVFNVGMYIYMYMYGM